MFHQFVEYLPKYHTTYEIGTEKSVSVSRHRYTNGFANISKDIGKDMLHIYPDNEFEYMHTSIDTCTQVPYTWALLKKTITDHITNYQNSLHVYERNWLIDDILINNKQSERILGSTGNIHFRIKYWALKRTSMYFPHYFIVPHSLGLVQKFHTETSKVLILDVQEAYATYLKMNKYRISSLSTINYGVDQLLQSLNDSGIQNISNMSYDTSTNVIGEKLIDSALKDFVQVYGKRLGDTGEYKIMLTGSLLHYPILSEKYIDMLSTSYGNFVGLYVGDGIVFADRDWSTDELYVKHLIYRFSKKQKLFTSFSAPTI